MLGLVQTSLPLALLVLRIGPALVLDRMLQMLVHLVVDLSVDLDQTLGLSEHLVAQTVLVSVVSTDSVELVSLDPVLSLPPRASVLSEWGMTVSSASECFVMGLELFLYLLLPLGRFGLEYLRLPLSFAVSLNLVSHLLLLIVRLEWVFLILGSVGWDLLHCRSSCP